MHHPKRLTTLAVLLAATLLSGCNRSAALRVINRSTIQLTNVVATGSGLTPQSIGSIPAGAQRSVSLRVPGESDLGLEFDANGKRFVTEPQGYLQGGYNYQVTATVAPDFTVTVDTER